jgi:indole-3-glycerol phosphate synthase
VTAKSDTVLGRILQTTREEVERRRQVVPLAELRTRAMDVARPQPVRAARLRSVLERPGIGVIAEFKRRSPSAGALAEEVHVGEIVTAYEQGGASALSILTEELNFAGSLADLRAARQASELPILRKDFILDPYQLYEAVLAGADAVLLIVAALDSEQLAALHDEAHALGLDVLVEVHDHAELDAALAVHAEIVGINNRDLRDFSVDVRRTSRLLADIPGGVVVVSESGIAGPEQVAELEQQGVHALLVGEALMRAPDPRHALATLLAGARFRAEL